MSHVSTMNSKIDDDDVCDSYDDDDDDDADDDIDDSDDDVCEYITHQMTVAKC